MDSFYYYQFDVEIIMIFSRNKFIQCNTIMYVNINFTKLNIYHLEFWPNRKVKLDNIDNKKQFNP